MSRATRFRDYPMWSPYDLFYWVRELLYSIYYMGFDAFGRFASYLLLGAVVVVPIFLVSRLLSYRR